MNSGGLPVVAGGVQGYTVLGASGFIGQRIVQALRRGGDACYAPERGSAEIFERDLGRVFYCIGLTADYAAKPFETVEAHVSFLSKILSHSRFDRLVYLSSTRVYDGLSHGKEGQALCLDPQNPRHLYDLSKALGENLCVMDSGSRACVARLANVYDSAPGSPGFLSRLLQQAREMREFSLASSPDFSRDYVHVDDVVASLKIMLDENVTGIVNVASGQNVSNQDIVNFLNHNGWNIQFGVGGIGGASPVCDITRLRELGVMPVALLDFLNLYIKDVNGDAAD
ncbi:hypothetical protein hmeg3_21245 [Herbaspirillum sp. meg3]|uniref:NAD-dependent epimerase/dehydratase family protein n=1 Tax=Herbaspirillum sp. meg3 TaxID=2025949 RepID=UPI000B989B38|nr:SDR family oxidoreductase [Herbaspirillum sp. meg3]ASU40574.1 hypothetical protein hmeg3_21245 [Herbaspirillum sp. meg3]